MPVRTLFLLLPILVLTACSGDPSGANNSTGNAGETATRLRIGNGAEPRTLDPHIVTDTTGTAILDALFDPLVRFDPVSRTFVPRACEQWEISDDGLVYTFTLPKAARWSNGDPVTAHDWEAGFRRALEPDVSTPYTQNFRGIVNALAFNNGDVTWNSVGIRAIDDLTLEVRFETPKLAFLGNLSAASFLPIHRSSVEAAGALTSINTNYFRGSSLIGNGPFRLVSWTANEAIIVERNPYYIEREAIHFERVEFLPIDNADTEQRSFATNAIQKTNTVPPANLLNLRTSRNPELREDDLYGTYFFRFNVKRPPLDDPRVRRALALSIDRYQITQFVTNGGQPEARSFVPPGLAGYVNPNGFEENHTEAKRLLAEAGFPSGQGFPRLTLIYNTSEGHRAIAQAVQSMWKNVLGIDITLLNQEWRVFLQTVEDGDFDIARSGWVGGTDPEGYLDLFNTESGNNHGHYSNPEFDQLFLAASQEKDATRRYDLFRQAEELILSDMPIIPIYHYKQFYLLKTNIEGWLNNPTGSMNFQNVRFSAQ